MSDSPDSPNPQAPAQSANTDERGILGSLWQSTKEIVQPVATIVVATGVVEGIGYGIKKASAIMSRKAVDETVGAQAKSMFGSSGYNAYR